MFLDDPEKFDPKKTEIIFFSVLKYIISSADILSAEFKFFLNVVKLYSAVAFNDAEFTSKILGYIYFHCFFMYFFNNYKNFDNNFEIKNEINLKHVISLIEIAFNFQTFGFDFPLLSILNTRLKYHYFLKIEAFLYGISESSSIPLFSTPKSNELEENLIFLANTISDNFEPFHSTFKKTIDSHENVFSLLNWNFQVFLITCFRWESDSDVLKMRKIQLHQERFPDIKKTNPPQKKQKKISYIIKDFDISLDWDDEIEDVDEFLKQKENLTTDLTAREDLPPAPPLSVSIISDFGDENNTAVIENSPNTADPLLAPVQLNLEKSGSTESMKSQKNRKKKNKSSEKLKENGSQSAKEDISSLEIIPSKKFSKHRKGRKKSPDLN